VVVIPGVLSFLQADVCMRTLAIAVITFWIGFAVDNYCNQTPIKTPLVGVPCTAKIGNDGISVNCGKSVFVEGKEDGTILIKPTKK
jgi:hypothetical protein